MITPAEMRTPAENKRIQRKVQNIATSLFLNSAILPLLDQKKVGRALKIQKGSVLRGLAQLLGQSNSRAADHSLRDIVKALELHCSPRLLKQFAKSLKGIQSAPPLPQAPQMVFTAGSSTAHAATVRTDAGLGWEPPNFTKRGKAKPFTLSSEFEMVDLTTNPPIRRGKKRIPLVDALKWRILPQEAERWRRSGIGLYSGNAEQWLKLLPSISQLQVAPYSVYACLTRYCIGRWGGDKGMEIAQTVSLEVLHRGRRDLRRMHRQYDKRKPRRGGRWKRPEFWTLFAYWEWLLKLATIERKRSVRVMVSDPDQLPDGGTDLLPALRESGRRVKPKGYAPQISKG